MRRGLRALTCLLIAWLWPECSAALVMQISNNSDINITGWSIGDPPIQATMDICIYGLDVPSLTSYAITISSSPAGFKLANGAQTLPYSLMWNDGGAGNLANTGTALSDGVKLSLRHNLNILLANCGGVPVARLIMQITQADMTAALSGTYTGTITLLLTPN